MTTEKSASEYWFPGRWLGGTAMIVGPLFMLAGTLLRIRFHFFFPQQLEAVAQHPRLMAAADACFVAGDILLWPAIATLARFVGRTNPMLATIGGAMVTFGLFARAFHGGADYMAYQLVRVEGVDAATRTVASSYGGFQVVSVFTAMILLGWATIAYGAYRARLLGIIRSVALGSMSALMIGVLKGSSAVSVITTTGLCIALVPMGASVLTAEPKPTSRQMMGWWAFLIALAVALYYFGQLG